MTKAQKKRKETILKKKLDEAHSKGRDAGLIYAQRWANEAYTAAHKRYQDFITELKNAQSIFAKTSDEKAVEKLRFAIEILESKRKEFFKNNYDLKVLDDKDGYRVFNTSGTAFPAVQ